MSTPAFPSASTAFSRLQSVGKFGLVGVGLSLTYQFTGIGLPCPWRVLTGTLCPLCGSTHLGVALLHLDFAGAWAANPFVFVLGVGLGLACVAWAIEALGGPAIRLPGRLGDSRLWWGALAVAAIAFTVVRNL